MQQDHGPASRGSRIVRTPLSYTGTLSELLSRLPEVARLVVLAGQWRCGPVLVSWDPLFMLDDPFDIDVGVREPHDDGAAFGGGWIGIWGYRLTHRLEQVPASLPRSVPQPEHRIGYYDRALRSDGRRWWLEQRLAPDDNPDFVSRRRAEMVSLIEALPIRPATDFDYRVAPLQMVPPAATHRARIIECQSHIAAGDIYQANLTARLDAEFAGNARALFCRALTALTPAYGAFVDGPDGSVASFSPELFLRREGRTVTSSPIKGTAALSTDPRLLLGSAKERAENTMIVDVMRNDLGRVALPGTVEVPALNRLERHHVWHLVSDVTCRLGPDVTDGDLLRATFPPASVTGAPKIRATQLLQELETTSRETYTGAIGYVTESCGLEMNVSIRTFEIAGGRIWLGVGGGIVADSDPDAEYTECLTKARPLVDAIGGVLGSSTSDAGRRAPVRDASYVDRTTDPVDHSIFETMLIEDGRPVDPQRHLARLGDSAEKLFGAGPDLEELSQAIHDQVAHLGPGPWRLRLDATPAPAGHGLVTRITTTPLDPSPASVELIPLTLSHGLGMHKWADRSRLPPLERPDQDHLVMDTDGTVLEAGRACVVCVIDDQIVTPPLDGRQLASTGRGRLQRLLERLGAPLVERSMTVRDLARADEVFVVNALRGILPVRSVLGVREWTHGWVTRWLQTTLRDRRDGRPRAGAAEPAAGADLRRSAKVLIIDNYDSFTFNLAQCIRTRGHRATVIRNDVLGPSQIEARFHAGEFTHLLISPGPGDPTQAGVSAELVLRLGPSFPTLGVCLGHQVIGHCYGADVGPAPTLTHGKATLVRHDGRGVYTGLPDPIVVGRYHSLAVRDRRLPRDLEVTSRSPNGTIMGLRHRDHPVEGIQWHPESVMSGEARRVVDTFLDQPR